MLRTGSGLNLKVVTDEETLCAGLHRPTRFSLNRMRILPIDEHYFEFNSEGTPVLGYLDALLHGRLDRILNALAATHHNLDFLLHRKDKYLRPFEYRRKPSERTGVHAIIGNEIDDHLRTAITLAQMIRNFSDTATNQEKAAFRIGLNG